MAITRESADSEKSLDLGQLSSTCYTSVHDMDRKEIIGNTFLWAELLESKPKASYRPSRKEFGRD